MVRAEATIINKLGLHARPASKLVKIASRGKSEVTMIHKGQRANGRSILGVILLQAYNGATITIEVSGADEQEVLDNILALIANKFEEE